MSTKVKTIVDLPKHTVIVPNGTRKYVYLTKKTYRNEKGQIRNDRVIIGRLTDDGRLYPNPNYYNEFHLPAVQNLPNTIRSCGSFAVCREIAKNLKLNELIEDIFPETYKQLLTASHYVLTQGNVLYYVDDWLDETLSFSADAMNDVALGRTLKSIREEDKDTFFKTWLGKNSSKEFVAYDVTSISSYSEKIADVEFGYNRDRENLPQINYGMYYNEQTKLPLYYNVYPGSITDKTHCQYMIEGTKKLDCSRVFFVMDKGFFTKDNLKYITDSNNRFMMTVPPTSKLFKSLVDDNFDEVAYNIDNKINGRDIHCIKKDSNIFGFRMNVHLYYNPSKIASDIAAFHEKIASMENDLSTMNVLPSIQSSYFDYFDIKQEENRIVYSKKADEIKKALKRCGFFAITETVFSKSSEEVLNIYSERDSIEKCFDDLKNALDYNRVHCSNEEILRGKLFISFLSLIFMSQMRNSLREYMRKKKYTMKKIFLELDKIKVAYDATNEEGYRLLNPLTKTQRDIIETLGMDEKIFNHLVE